MAASRRFPGCAFPHLTTNRLTLYRPKMNFLALGAKRAMQQQTKANRVYPSLVSTVFLRPGRNGFGNTYWLPR